MINVHARLFHYMSEELFKEIINIYPIVAIYHHKSLNSNIFNDNLNKTLNKNYCPLATFDPSKLNKAQVVRIKRVIAPDKMNPYLRSRCNIYTDPDPEKAHMYKTNLEHYLTQEIEKYENIIKIMSKISEEQWLKLIRFNADFFRFVPKNHMTYNICHETMKRNGHYIEYVPKKFITSFKMYWAAIGSGMTYARLPYYFRTTQFMKRAVKSSPGNIIYILQTDDYHGDGIPYDICCLAAKNLSKIDIPHAKHVLNNYACSIYVEDICGNHVKYIKLGDPQEKIDSFIKSIFSGDKICVLYTINNTKFDIVRQKYTMSIEI
jgi:hypothetical protein